jgi:type IV pilus assembly protein PilQ
MKLRRMTEMTRIALIAGMVTLGVASAEAGLFGRKADKAEAPAAAQTLRAVEIEESRVVLRTTGAPAYTSYSPSPGVFVVDLAGAAPDGALAIPSVLPAGVASISADPVVEMGSSLTRITLRLSDSIQPEVAAIENAVVVLIPDLAPPPVEEVMPVVVPLVTEQVPVVVEEEMPRVEPVDDEPVMVVRADTPQKAAADLSDAPRARSVRSVGADAINDAVEVRVEADGRLTYKAFKLDNPSRLVLDFTGVKNLARVNTVDVDDENVKRVRIAQFQPDVARVVIDVARHMPYEIDASATGLTIAFGGAIARTTTDAVKVAEATPVPPPSAPAPAKVTETKPVAAPGSAPSVPVIAENAPGWKMPQESKGARKVINAPLDQAPAQQPPTQEDVFTSPQQAATTMVGSRTLSTGPRVFTGEPFSLDLKDADIRDVLRMFSELTGLNIAIDPNVPAGSVTVNFTDVPWDQALDLILRMNGLTYVLEGNVMRIGTIDRITAETAAARRLQEEERLNVPLTTLSIKLSYARSTEVAALLRDLASPRARIITDARTNQLIISEIPEYLSTMQNLIQTIDIPTPQVMIEARIVESSRTFSQQWGFEWGFGGDIDPALGTSTGLVFPNRIGYEAGPFDFGVGDRILSLSLMDVLGTFNLDLALNAAESQGYVKVVSAPRVTTQDNQAASIQSGFQIPYQTRVNFTTTVQYVDATLNLTVTPQITEAGTVIMQIAVTKNEPATGLAIVGDAGTPITTRTATTRMMVRDGGTAVVGGIFRSADNDAESRVPFVHNIPILGALFRSHNINTSHDELLIFITPRIIRG